MKVKIRMLRATVIGQPETAEPYVAVPGDEVEVSQATAQLLVGLGKASHVKGDLYVPKPAPEPEEEVVEAAVVEPSETATAAPARAGGPRRRTP